MEKTVRKLCQMSEDNFIDPFSRLEWPEELAHEQWFMSPELISLFGSECFDALTDAERKRLSFFEAVNFFSLNIHGERRLAQGLARRLYRRGNEVISPYLHHFLDEENKHMFFFGRFCTRYAGKVYPEKKIETRREYAPGEDDFLFFACVLIFEETVDVYNRRMGRDERLVPIAREINQIHHFEEARHLAFGRKLVRELFDAYAPGWTREVIERVRAYLAAYLRATWGEFYNPSVYEDAGIGDALALRRRVIGSPVAHAHRQAISRGCVKFFCRSGILAEEPVL